MPRRVRSDVILRRFLAGESVFDVALDLGATRARIERAIRNALNRNRSKP